MKKILIVSGSTEYTQNSAGRKELHTFLDNLLGKDAEVLSTHLDYIEYLLEPGVFAAHDTMNDIDLTSVDCVFMRGPKLRARSDLAYYLSRYCAWNNIPFMNDYSGHYPGTKVAQSIVFLEEKAPFLATLHIARTELLVQRAQERFGFPYILKSNIGSHGEANYLVRDAEQARRILAQKPNVDFLAQEFCPNDRDYRLLLMGDTKLTFERRGKDGSHLNNTSQGGDAALADDVLPPEIVADSHRIARRLGLTIAGVDVMPNSSTGSYYFLEVNSQPQLYTGAFLAQKKEGLRRLFGV